MKSWEYYVPYVLMAGVFIPWCLVIAEVFNSKLPFWFSIFVAIAGFYGWVLIYRIVNKYNKE